jgi:hypothetical protein
MIESPGPIRIDWQDELASVMRLAPPESDQWSILHAYAEDAIASLAYSIRCLITGDPQEAAWAARRAYESADQAAINQLRAEFGRDGAESDIAAHGIVQRELRRQVRDLRSLEIGAPVVELKKLAFQESLLEKSELLA